MSSAIREWSFPTRVVFGQGAAERLSSLCADVGMKAPLLVTDPGLAATSMIDALRQALSSGGVAAELYSGVRSNPTASDVDEGVAAFVAGSHDGVIAVGGGSALDAGKAIAFMSRQSRSIFDFEDVGDNWTLAEASGLPPVIAIPTTAGTGSEVGRASVVTNVETHVKKIIFHPGMMPRVALLDPELTRGLPAGLTAATGFDAYVHCFEAFCAPGYHPMADGIALEGMRLIAEALPRAVADGNDMAARADMMAAAAMGAVAFQKGLGGVHALSHAVGATHDTHHGLTNAVLMPYLLRVNRPAIEGHTDRIVRFLGMAAPGFDTFFEHVLNLRSEIAIPETLSDLVPEPAAAEKIGNLAAEDPTASGNPIALDPSAYADLYRAALSGAL